MCVGGFKTTSRGTHNAIQIGSHSKFTAMCYGNTHSFEWGDVLIRNFYIMFKSSSTKPSIYTVFSAMEDKAP